MNPVLGWVFSSITTPKCSLHIFLFETLRIGPNPTIMQAFLLWRLSVLYPPQSLKLYGHPLKSRWRLPYTCSSRILFTCRVRPDGNHQHFWVVPFAKTTIKSQAVPGHSGTSAGRLRSVVWHQLEWIQCNEP
jgi:hypothetical protein